MDKPVITLQEFQAQAVEHAQNVGAVQAARDIHIGKTTMYRWMHKAGVPMTHVYHKHVNGKEAMIGNSN